MKRCVNKTRTVVPLGASTQSNPFKSAVQTSEYLNIIDSFAWVAQPYGRWLSQDKRPEFPMGN